MSRTPPRGNQFVTEDVTGVGRVPFQSDGEAQIYRDVRDLRKSHRALVERVGGIETSVARMDGKVDTLLSLQRSKSPSSEGRSAAKEALAEQVLASQRETKRFWHSVGVKVAGGFFSGAVLVALAKHFGWL